MTGTEIKQHLARLVAAALPGYDGRVLYLTVEGGQNSVTVTLAKAAAEQSGLLNAVAADPLLHVVEDETGEETGPATGGTLLNITVEQGHGAAAPRPHGGGMLGPFARRLTRPTGGPSGSSASPTPAGRKGIPASLRMPTSALPGHRRRCGLAAHQTTKGFRGKERKRLWRNYLLGGGTWGRRGGNEAKVVPHRQGEAMFELILTLVVGLLANAV